MLLGIHPAFPGALVDHLKAVAISKRIIESHKRWIQAERERVKADLIQAEPGKAAIEEWLEKKINERVKSKE